MRVMRQIGVSLALNMTQARLVAVISTAIISINSNKIDCTICDRKGNYLFIGGLERSNFILKYHNCLLEVGLIFFFCLLRLPVLFFQESKDSFGMLKKIRVL
jgi:hypothetical protein